jgi:hypothetical protein
MPTSKQSLKLFRMGTWTDSFLSSFQFWIGWVAIIGTALGLISAVSTLLARQEISARQSAKEEQRTSRIQAAEAELETTRAKLIESREETRAVREIATKADAAARPRRLSPEQNLSIIESLKAISDKPKIFMIAGIFDAEAVTFGKDIEAVFKASGFEVYFPTELHDDAALGMGTSGIHLVVKDTTKPNPTAVQIQKSFVSSGIQLPAMSDNDDEFPADRIMIAIGQKP